MVIRDTTFASDAIEYFIEFILIVELALFFKIKFTYVYTVMNIFSIYRNGALKVFT